MFVAKLKVVLAIGLTLVVLGTPGVRTYYLRGQEEAAKRENSAQTPSKEATDKAPEKNAHDLKVLMQEPLKLAQDVLKITWERHQVDPLHTKWQDIVDATQRAFKADLELSPNNAARIAAHQRHVKAVEGLVRFVDKAVQNRSMSKLDSRLMRYLLIDAKIELEREKTRK